MLDDFLIRAAFAGVGVAVATAPLGCFVVWHRMVYFSDATAHAAILGVALALLLEAPIFAGTLVAALAMALAVTFMGRNIYAFDTILGVMAHSALAIGLVAVSLIGGVRVDLHSLLFGDILAVSRNDLIIIWLGAAVVFGLTIWRWSPLLITTLNPDVAQAAGIDSRRESFFLTLSLAVTVAVAIKVVGILLIGALLVIPAASARCFARTPEVMAALAVLFGVVSAIAGLRVSFFYDTPSGPTIVCLLALIFTLTNIGRSLRRARAERVSH
ncbi:MAG: metal ABC transporter permease [Aestuariivita sp.]|nr:metal ABC transporter permease [Aestuariivita sp.]MCY4201806.1 metal ABC transporter permease [Aestuariivita sp.]MCY4289110.1 metal ABC transporter permease [Aestuariivita sp.]MCY4347710.1 metal ABC transporter permease [Aestuariivita sp.]